MLRDVHITLGRQSDVLDRGVDADGAGVDPGVGAPVGVASATGAVGATDAGAVAVSTGGVAGIVVATDAGGAMATAVGVASRSVADGTPVGVADPPQAARSQARTSAVAMPTTCRPRALGADAVPDVCRRPPRPLGPPGGLYRCTEAASRRKGGRSHAIVRSVIVVPPLVAYPDWRGRSRAHALRAYAVPRVAALVP